MFLKVIVVAMLLIATSQANVPSLTTCQSANCTGVCSSATIPLPSCTLRRNGAYYKVNASGHSCGTCWHLESFSSSTDCGATGSTSVSNRHGRCGSCTYASDLFHADSYYKVLCGADTIDVVYYYDGACASPSASATTAFTLNKCSRSGTGGSTRFKSSGMNCEFWEGQPFSDSACTIPPSVYVYPIPSDFVGGICIPSTNGGLTISTRETVGLNCSSSAAPSSSASSLATGSSASSGSSSGSSPSGSSNPPSLTAVPSRSICTSELVQMTCQSTDCSNACRFKPLPQSCVSHGNGNYFKIGTSVRGGTCFRGEVFLGSRDCGATGSNSSVQTYGRCGSCAYVAQYALYSQYLCGSKTLDVKYYSDKTCTTETNSSEPTSVTLNSCIAGPYAFSHRLTSMSTWCLFFDEDQFVDSDCTIPATAAQQVPSDSVGGICTSSTIGDLTVSTRRTITSRCSATAVASIACAALAILTAVL